MSALDRVLSRVELAPPPPGLPVVGACWLFPGTNGGGYGVVRVGDRVVYAHRLVRAELVAPIPEGHELDHLCRRTACANPWHVEPVTTTEHRRRLARSTCRTAGHELDEINVYVYPSGRRECRRCRRSRASRRRSPRPPRPLYC